MNTADDELDRLVTVLLTASRALVGVSARSLEEVVESVTLTQFRTLVVLAGHGPSRLNQLAERLGVGASSALRTVDRLVDRGLVDRQANPGDRREVVIRLTDAGRELVDGVTEARRHAIAGIVRAVPERERAGLIDALAAFAAAAEEPQVADAATLLGW